MSHVPRFFDLLIKVLPKRFRDEHREGIHDLASAYARDKRPLARALMWARAAIDILVVAFVLRVRRSRRGSWQPNGTERRRGASSLLERLILDIGMGLRSIRRDRRLAAFAILIVGLGIGASVTVFSVVNALLLRPLPFHDPDELVWISNGEWGRGQQLSSLSVQVNHLLDLREQSEQLVDVAGYSLFDRAGDHTITDGGRPERLTRLRVTYNFFDVLGIAPELGRSFTEEEVQWNGPNVVLLDNGFWGRRFGADPTIVGRTITLNEEAFTVVGVLPKAFDFEAVFAPGNPIDFVTPFPLSPETNRQGNTLALIGRLAPRADLEAAHAEASLIAARPTSDRRNDFTPQLTPLHTHVSGQFRAAVIVLAAAVGLVMLIACANLSNLLLARGAAREKEIAIRSALGANRWRLLRHTLFESVILSLSGALVGLVLAVGGTRILTQLDVNIPLLTQVRVDGSALLFALVAAVVTGIVFGMMPAWRLSSLAPQLGISEGSRGSTQGKRHGWIRGALVVSEVALACILLIGAGLLMRSFLRVVDVELGFQPHNAITLRIDPAIRPPTHALRASYVDEALRRVRSAPGVETAGTTDVLPTAFNRRWCLEDDQCPFIRVVSEDYLDAMGLSLVDGRDFTLQDNFEAPPVAIVNEQLAELVWPGQNPLGRTARVYRGTWADFEVVGVVRGMRHLTPEQEPGPEIFFTFRQMPDFRMVHLIVRGPQLHNDLASAVRAALTPLNPDLPLNEFQPVQEIIDRSLSARRFVVWLLGGFAIFAVGLASFGIYSVISYSVQQRAQEMGIRMALGASAGRLQQRILFETLRLATAGMVVGLTAAWMLARLIQGLLFGIDASDPLTFVGAPVLLFAIAAIAGYFPSRRATNVDPVVTLRAEA